MCERAATPKCGPQVTWHWAHACRRHCDPWWENETDWHRAWKSHFPEDWQEVVLFDDKTGEKHVADVRTGRGMVIEFQHSAMSLDEMRSREAFYGHMLWIVDGRGFAKQFDVRSDPLPHLQSSLLDRVVFANPHADMYFDRKEWESAAGRALVEVHRAAEIRQEVLRDYRGHHFFRWVRPRTVWMEATAPVFLDFGGDELFRLTRYRPESQWCVQRVPKTALIAKNGGNEHPNPRKRT